MDKKKEWIKCSTIVVGFYMIVYVLLVYVFPDFFSGLWHLGLILICLLPLLCLLIPLGFLASVYLQQSTIAIVVEDRGVFDGLRRGWQVFRQNLGVMIVMGLILWVAVGGIGGLIIASPLFLLMAPIIVAMVNNTSQAWMSAFLISGLCLLAYLPFLIVLNGALQSYIAAAWTLTFMRLTTTHSLEEAAPEPSFESLPEPG